MGIESISEELDTVQGIFQSILKTSPIVDREKNFATITWITTTYQVQVLVKGNGYASVFIDDFIIKDYFTNTNIPINDISSDLDIMSFVGGLHK